MDYEKIEKYLSLMKKYDITELEFESEDSKFKVKRAGDTVQAITPQVAQAVQAAAGLHVVPNGIQNGQAHVASPIAVNGVTEETTDGSNEQETPEEDIVKSPVVGVYYSSPSPDEDPFVSVGDHVEEGDTVCIIEAMKLMNEVPAHKSGVVKEILAGNGQKVEYGQHLMIIE